MAGAIKFKGLTKKDRLAFVPGTAYAFEDPAAVPYFKACGWADDTDDEPVVTIGLGELSFDDPDAYIGGGPNKGRKVSDLIAGG